MQKKNIKNKTSHAANWQNIRIHQSTRKKADAILKKANSKKEGRTVKLNDLINLSLDRITENDIKILQNESLRVEDHFEKMRLFYCKTIESISKKDFTAFSMKLEYIDFLKSYHKSQTLSTAQGGI